MKAGDVVIYRTTGPLAHVRAGCPGMVREAGQGVALVEFVTLLERVPLGDIAPARLWGRRGAAAWLGPFDAFPDAMAALAPLCGNPGALEAGLAPAVDSALGAAAIVEGWRYRLAWGGDDPPARFETRPG